MNSQADVANPGESSADRILSIRGLTKTYDGKTNAVDGISFGVMPGEIFGFLGPNGAGKSTTINMLTTILRPSSREAEVCGHDLVREQGAVRRAIGVVPQDSTADADLTGLENVMLCADFYGIPRKISAPRALELLRLVELERFAKNKVMTYSGGMRRRLEIASGLISRPTLLFLDEPTLGLDVQTRAAVWDYIRLLKAQYGMTLFLTTHYLDEADALCDRIAIIDHGKILRIGSPVQLKDSLGVDTVEIEVQDGSMDLSGKILQLEHVKEVKKIGAVYRVKTEFGEKTAPAIIETLRMNGSKTVSISISRPSLDEVYLQYTGRSIRDERDDSSSHLPGRGYGMGMGRR